MRAVWNLLYGFPGDTRAEYEHYLTLIPLLHHLQPPKCLGAVNIIRFSPYFKQAADYGIKHLRPAAVYTDMLPAGTDLNQLAYYFDAEFPSIATQHPDLVAAIEARVQSWIESWAAASDWLPMLSITRYPPDVYLLADTRGLPGTAWLIYGSRPLAICRWTPIIRSKTLAYVWAEPWTKRSTFLARSTCWSTAPEATSRAGV